MMMMNNDDEGELSLLAPTPLQNRALDADCPDDGHETVRDCPRQCARGEQQREHPLFPSSDGARSGCLPNQSRSWHDDNDDNVDLKCMYLSFNRSINHVCVWCLESQARSRGLLFPSRMRFDDSEEEEEEGEREEEC